MNRELVFELFTLVNRLSQIFICIVSQFGVNKVHLFLKAVIGWKLPSMPVYACNTSILCLAMISGYIGSPMSRCPGVQVDYTMM